MGEIETETRPFFVLQVCCQNSVLHANATSQGWTLQVALMLCLLTSDAPPTSGVLVPLAM